MEGLKNAQVIKLIREKRGSGKEIIAAIMEQTTSKREADAVTAELIRQLETNAIKVSSIKAYVIESDDYIKDIIAIKMLVSKGKGTAKKDAPLSTIEKVKIQIATLEDEGEDTDLFEEILEKLEAAQENAEGYRAEIEELKGDVKEKEAEVKKLKDELEELKGDVKEKEAEVKKLKDELEDLRKGTDSEHPAVPTEQDKGLTIEAWIKAFDELSAKFAQINRTTRGYKKTLEPIIEASNEEAILLRDVARSLEKDATKKEPYVDELLKTISANMVEAEEIEEKVYLNSDDLSESQGWHEGVIERLNKIVSATQDYLVRYANIDRTPEKPSKKALELARKAFGVE